MGSNERSTLLPKKKKGLVHKSHKKDKDTYAAISFKDHMLRNLNIVLYGCAIVIGDFTKAQYIYKWVSSNTILSDFYNISSTGNGSQQCSTNSSSAAENEYQRISADWALYMTLTERGIALPVLIFFGIYSDLIGRKPLMVVSVLSQILKYGSISFFIYKDLHIWYLIVSYAISGLGGCNFLFYLGIFAAIADTTARTKQRSFSMVTLDALIGISALIAQISAGYIIKYVGYVYITMLVAGLCGLVLLSIILLYRETRTNQQANSSRTKISWNVCDAIRRITGFYTDKEQRRNMPLSILLITAIVFNLLYAAHNGKNDIEILYAINFPFCWSSVKIGYYRAAKDFLQFGVSVLFVKVLHYCTSDEVICIIGCVSGIATFTLTAFASRDWMLYCAAAIGVLSICPISLMRGIFSKTVLPDKQGALFANIYIFEVLCSLSGSAICNNVYAETQGVMKGLAFLVVAGFYVISLGLLIGSFCIKPAIDETSLHLQDDSGQETQNRGGIVDLKDKLPRLRTCSNVDGQEIDIF